MDKRHKILIVDDRKENLIALRQVLGDVDADIVEATSGNQALTATLAHDFSLAILDVQMPGMDGYELADFLRGDPKTTRLPIIFMTAAYGAEVDVFRGYDSGAVDYIVKPYTPGILLAKVRVFLNLRQAQKELARKVFELAVSEKRYRTLVMTMPDIVYCIDAEGRFTFLNDAVRSLGYSPEELIGLPFAEILSPADVESVSRRFLLRKYAGKHTGDTGAPKLFDERRSDARQTLTLEVRLVSRKAGQSVPAELHGGVLTVEVNSSGLYCDTEGGSPIFLGTVGVVRDITQRKCAEAELSRYRQQLEEMVEEKTVALTGRIKQINCLYSFSSLVTEPCISIDNAFKDLVKLIPTGFRHSEIACARIVFAGREFASDGFRETQWQQSADILVSGKAVGAVAVCYLEESPPLDEGPFLKEERALINALAGKLGILIQREQTYARLEHVNRVLASIRDVNKLIVRENRPGPLIQAACDSLTRSRGLNGAWIVLTDRLTDHIEGAQSGFDETAFSKLLKLFSKGETPICFGHGKTGSGVNVVVDPGKTCGNCPLDNAFAGNGAITIELRYDGILYGYIGLAVPMQFANDKEEASLFEEVAGDIAFALASIEQKEALAASEKSYNMLFDGTADGILVTDATHHTLKYVNPALCRMLGYPAKELLRLEAGDIHPKDVLSEVTAVFNLNASGKAAMRLGLPCLCKDGTLIYANIHSTLANIDGQPCRMSFFTDVTQQVRLESEKGELATQLLQAQKMEALGQMAGGIAHDYNNITGIILGYGELTLNKLAPEDPLRQNVQEMYNAALRSRDITQQLMAFARQQKVLPSVLDLNEAVDGMIKMLGRLLGESIQLLWEPGPDLWQIRMDPSQLVQILTNLCVNAHDAIQDVGKVSIATQNRVLDEAFCSRHPDAKPGEYLMLTVRDDGCGMDRLTMEKIFDPFFTTKEIGKGTGLGLSTVFGIVKQNEGFIDVHGDRGKGTTFRIFLPRFIGKASEVIQKETMQLLRSRGETVLVTEDEEAFLELIETALVQLGYTVLSATRPGDALHLAQEHPGGIDLLITDVVMPEMNGKELGERLQTGYPGIKVIYTSGHTLDAISQRGVMVENTHFLRKPFLLSELAAMVRAVLTE